MKIDLHVHCREASRCAEHQPKEIPAFYAENNVDALVITNHYHPGHLGFFGEDPKVQAEKYIEQYYEMKEAGDKVGVTVIFGAEVMLTSTRQQAEFLLYGFTPEKMRQSFPLHTMTQKELFEYCNSNEILMYQSHPTRKNHRFADPRYMHGIEILNGPVLLKAYYEYAIANNLKYCAGSDFHAKEQVSHAGIHFVAAGSAGIVTDRDIKDSVDLYNYLKDNSPGIFTTDGILDLDNLPPDNPPLTVEYIPDEIYYNDAK